MRPIVSALRGGFRSLGCGRNTWRGIQKAAGTGAAAAWDFAPPGGGGGHSAAPAVIHKAVAYPADSGGGPAAPDGTRRLPLSNPKDGGFSRSPGGARLVGGGGATGGEATADYGVGRGGDRLLPPGATGTRVPKLIKGLPGPGLRGGGNRFKHTLMGRLTVMVGPRTGAVGFGTTPSPPI